MGREPVTTLPSFEELARRADAARARRPLVVAGAADAGVLAAVRAACDRGWVEPILVGREAAVRSAAGALGTGIEDMRIVDASEPAGAAVSTARACPDSILMKGQIATPALMRAILAAEGGLRSGKPIAQVVLMEVARDGRRFLMTDTGVIIRPELETRIELVHHVVAVSRALGHASPRVALMAASESATAGMPDTLEAAEIARRFGAGGPLEMGVAVGGPLSFDLAYAAGAAATKGVGGPVAGAADAMVFPDLVSANLTVKAIMYTADCAFGGVLVGATRPVAFMSRADTIETRLRSMALALALVSR